MANAIAKNADITFSIVEKSIIKMFIEAAKNMETYDIITPLNSKVYLHFCSTLTQGVHNLCLFAYLVFIYHTNGYTKINPVHMIIFLPDKYKKLLILQP